MMNERHGSAGSMLVVCLLLTTLALAADEPETCNESASPVDRVRAERITGSLEKGEALARRALECVDLEDGERRRLRIELAKVLDRQGLHHHTRPVVEALELLREAEAALDLDDVRGRGEIDLALAEYFYRAEMSERKFETASAKALEAERGFKRLGESSGEADAVHRQGLIELQKRNLEEARELFDRSLEIEQRGPRRPIFLSDYHRHIGIVELWSGNRSAAIPHLETSLELRDKAGSRDYGMFARTMLGAVLVSDGRAAEARPILEEAVRFARAIPSPVGEMRATLALGEVYEILGERDAGIEALGRTAELAAELGSEGSLAVAREGLERLKSTRD